MKRPHASDDVRERALAAVDDGHRVVDVAAMYHIDPSTLRRWRRQRVRTGACRVRARSGRPRRIGPADEETLRAQVTAFPDATLAEHCARWSAAHEMTVSVPTMGRALQRLGLTLKKRHSLPGSGTKRPGRTGARPWPTPIRHD